MEYTKETAIDFVRSVLVRNGFREEFDGRLTNDDCIVKIEEDHYKVSFFHEDFLEWVEWFSKDLTIYSLMGFLSWYDFIERGYSR
jgi:hypothetical protein